LLAEDNSVNQKVAETMLARLGYRIDIVGNGSEAVDAVKRQPYDVVLMDLHMPVVDGLEATCRIQRLFRGSSLQPKELQPSRPYIVALTASALEEERQRCFAAGMDDYVSKPVTLDRLTAALLRAIHHTRDGESPVLRLDRSPLEALERDVGAAAVVAVVDSYLRDAPLRIEALRSALVEHDSAVASREAHTLKSSSATVGAMTLAAIAEQLEAATEIAVSESMIDDVKQISQLFEQIAPLLEAERARRVPRTSAEA
jgi:CheY-like chemotaxis protein/HPt (histidine-containing phosphotransfer) domain-containing protein